MEGNHGNCSLMHILSLSEWVCHIVCFPTIKSMRIVVFSPSYPYYTLVHNHIWISYFIPYFHLLECRFIPRHRGSTFCLFICSEIVTHTKKCTNHDEVHPPFFLSLLEVAFNHHMAHIWNAFRHVDCVFDHIRTL